MVFQNTPEEEKNTKTLKYNNASDKVIRIDELTSGT